MASYQELLPELKPTKVEVVNINTVFVKEVKWRIYAAIVSHTAFGVLLHQSEDLGPKFYLNIFL